jgi:SAM-dependent methyltransferase
MIHDIKPWHDQDTFWDTVEPILFAQQRLSDAPLEVEKIISLLRLQQGMKVLDLCCGVGRHSIELARHGFSVTGIDRTQIFLDKASKFAANEGLEAEFVREDMRAFYRPEAFNAVVNLFTSFGYFEDQEEDRQVVKNVYCSLKAGGVFLIDMMGKEVLARIYQERDWHEEDGILILEERKITKNWSWMENRWIMLKDNNRVELNLSHRIYSAVELNSLLTDCGFAHTNIYGDLGGRAYDHAAKRLVMVAYK